MSTTFIFLFLFLEIATCISSTEDNFTFNGFGGTKLSLDGIASITSNGLLQLTNATRLMSGHAFNPIPLNFKSSVGKTLSFSTTFVFAIISEYSDVSSHGIAFVISPTTNFSTAFPMEYMGLLNRDNNGNPNNRILAIELDTIQNPEFEDINDNHVGIDIDSLQSSNSHVAGYYAAGNDNLTFKNLSLHSGLPMQVWVDFDGEGMQLNVTMSPVQMPKPSVPLLSSTVNLSRVILDDQMYVGFSSATGSSNYPSHYILGWSFMMNGEAESLDYKKLPRLPRMKKTKMNFKVLAISLPLVSCAIFLILLVAVIMFTVLRRIKYAELLEDWEREYGPHRFSYKDLLHATGGFKDERLVGIGGFGRVYRGVLPAPSNKEIAVKRVSHDSGQGMKEFVAEIVSIGRLRHRNIAQLLGYCRRKGELLLVYDFMPNGSLDKFLYDRTKPSLNWVQRYRIIKGVASGLVYLHQEWEQLVIHRDIKASNVLLDGEMNGVLGDFGLARLCRHGFHPQTTRVVGTIGYIAPELARTGKATTMTDVFAFGAFLLEVACGRRPMVFAAPHGQHPILVDWVLENWKMGSLLATVDPRILRADEEYYSSSAAAEEMEMVLKLGLLCTHPITEVRPSMQQVMLYLDGHNALPHELSPAYNMRRSYNSYPSLMQINKEHETSLGSLSVATISNTSLEAR